MFQFQNVYKLNTKEDEYHIHKLLGGFCLLNFIYRFYSLLSQGTMFLHTPTGLFSVIIHGILSISSLQFHISNVRNTTKPMIYPEFRMHSILFGLRSVIITIMYYYEMNYKYIIVVCYSVLFLSELITINYNINNRNKNTMRDIPFETKNEFLKKEMVEMYSIMQIGATTFMLGNINSAFSPLLAIQTAAFFMTLVRKSIITSNAWHYLYTMTLVMNYLLFPTFSPSFLLYLVFVITIHQVIIFPYKINKYIAWGFHFSIFVILREYVLEELINRFFLKHYYLLWLLLKLWIIGKCVSFEKYFEQFLDNDKNE
jgi:hypothetical protein